MDEVRSRVLVVVDKDTSDIHAILHKGTLKELVEKAHDFCWLSGRWHVFALLPAAPNKQPEAVRNIGVNLLVEAEGKWADSFSDHLRGLKITLTNQPRLQQMAEIKSLMDFCQTQLKVLEAQHAHSLSQLPQTPGPQAEGGTPVESTTGGSGGTMPVRSEDHGDAGAVIVGGGGQEE